MPGGLAVSYRNPVAAGIVLTSLVAEAFANLRTRRMQAALSAFGIATGITAVVLLVALVSGIHRFALQSIRSLGADLLQVSIETDPSAVGDPQGHPMTLRPDDVGALMRGSSLFSLAVAENGSSAVVRGVVVQGTSYRQDQNGNFIAVRGARAMQTQVRGFTEGGFELQNLHVEFGRLPLPDEHASGARVAILGAKTAERIFNAKPAVGETIVLGDFVFRVAGVLKWVGEPEGEFRSFLDDAVYAPFETVAAVFRGNDTASSLRLRLRTPGSSAEAIPDARAIIVRNQQSSGRTSGQVRIRDAAENLREFTLVVNVLKLIAGLVGGIGLFVGAVGVANVLLVSVRERTQEIGVRRAVGATRQDIFLGFLVEALGITLGGGLAGLALAWILTKIAGLIPAIPDGAEPFVSPFTALTAVVLLVLVGLVAGVGPARRAASVYPSEALRAE